MNILASIQKSCQRKYLIVRCLSTSTILNSDFGKRNKLYDQIIADVEQTIKDNSKVFARKGFVHHSARSVQSKNANLRSALQSVQQKIMEQTQNTISNIPSAASIEVLGNGTCHLRPCVIIRTPFKVYMFNCPEGVSRFLPQLRVKSLNVNDIFVTQGTWDNIAGISSILLSKENNALPTRIHGAMNVKHFLECIRPFQDSDYGSTKYPSQVIELPFTTGSYEDAAVKIDYIPLTPALNDGITEDRVDVAYFVKLKPPPRRIDPKKLIALQVPKGPLIGNLKNGQSITLSDGRTIKPADVFTDHHPDADKDTVLIVDCASNDHVKAFAQHSMISNILESKLHYVVHLSSPSVMKSSEYKSVLDKLGTDCSHIVVNSDCPTIPGIESIFRNHRLLNSVCPSLFPPLHPTGFSGLLTQGSEFSRQESGLLYASPLQRFWMREKGGEEPIIMDLRETNNEIPKTADNLIRNIQKDAANILMDCEFPRVTFLGTSSAVPSKYRNVTGYILEMSQESALMVDVGEGSYGQMEVLFGPKRIDEMLMKLKCICITHAHQDHMNGLFTLIKRRKEAYENSGKQYKSVVLVLNRNVIKPFNTYSMCFEDLTQLVSLVDISRHPITPPVSPGGPANKRRRLPSPTLSATRNVLEQMPTDLFDSSWNLTEFKAVQVHHTRMANGFVFGVNNKRVVFSGDTKPCDLLVEEGQGADLLIHEATFEDGHEADALRKKHSTMGQAIDVGKRMNAKFIILTHFSARYPKVPELPAYLEKHGNVGVAMDLLSVRLDHLPLVPKLIPIFRELYHEELFEIELRKQQRKLRKEQETIESKAISMSEDVADVRIILIGGSGTGKTSLVMSLLEDEWVDHVPQRLDRVLIPADVTPENVTTSIVDCSTEKDDNAFILQELKQANVVCIVYTVSDEATISSVTEKWLPLVRDVFGAEHEVPVILVGNKSDGPTNHTEKVLPIMESWPEVETCVECSAKTMKNVSEIFYYAQKAVVYPTRPLYDADDKRVTDKARKALIRVFKICDRDNDGYLNDTELNEFQKLCFGIPLTTSAIEDVKRAVSDGCPDGVVDEALALNGFLYLHLLFIERGRHETSWTVLRKFGYDGNLKLCEDYLYPRIQMNIGCSTELSPEGIQFVSALFEKHDEDKDGCLSPSELANLFSVCPAASVGKEILAAVETNARGWMTYNGFMAYWNMTTLTNMSQASEQLAYLGFAVGRSLPGRAGSVKEAIKITRERKVDLLERGTDRKVFQCLVVGAKDAGKTVFMQSLVGRGLADVAGMARRHSPYVIHKVKVKEEQKYLLLREVDVLSPQDALTSAETAADVVAFLYDVSNPDSFSFCATVYQKYFYRTKTPCVMIATKVEREEVDQKWEVSPEEFCRQFELPKPIRFCDSQIGRAAGPVFEQLTTMAVYPHLRRVFYLHDSNLLSKITFGAALAALAGFLVFKNL